jgi:hypothetical protein
VPERPVEERKASMARWPLSDDDLRAMYLGGKGNPTARRFARFWARYFALGLAPRRWVTLEVAGRRSGRTVRFPLGMADWGGRWYLVPMLGGACNWVKNVGAAHGQALIRHGRAKPVQLVEVPVSERPPIMKRYLQKVPGARPPMPIDRNAPIAEFEVLAARFPVFEVVPTGSSGSQGPTTSSVLSPSSRL